MNDLPPPDKTLAPDDWQAIDLLLGQGTEDELAAMRNDVARDPLRALELADTVTMVEQFRQLRIEASPAFAGRLQGVVRRADRFQRDHYLPRTAGWKLFAAGVAAAAVTFIALSWLDPGQWFRPEADASGRAATAAAFGAVAITEVGTESSEGSAPPVPLITSEERNWQQTLHDIQARLELETSEELRAALQAGLQRRADALDDWIEPSNILVLTRLDHELRQQSEVRRQALRERGVMVAVDKRVQELADGLTRELATRLAGDPDAVPVAVLAYGMRALIGAGDNGQRAAVVNQCGAELAGRLPRLHGAALVTALSALVEEAAIRGEHFDVLKRQGRRLLDEVLGLDADTWRRGRPDLLGGRVAATTLGEAGRVLRRLPAFGVDGRRSELGRELLLGQLRERRTQAQDRPEVLAAMLYGFHDLLADGESDRVVFALRRWKPTRLAPDYRTVQQMAWGLTPGTVGFARMQRELRQLAVLPAPEALTERAAFCLCLATNYAGFVGDLLDHARAVRNS